MAIGDKEMNSRVIWLKVTVLVLMLWVPCPTAEASDDEGADSPKPVSRKKDRDVVDEDSHDASGSTHKKRRGKGKQVVAIDNGNASRAPAVLTFLGNIPFDVFWKHIAIYLEMADINNCGVVSRNMQARIKAVKARVVAEARAHYAKCGIMGFEEERLIPLIRLNVPIIPIAVDSNALRAANLVAQTARDRLIRHSRARDERGYPLVNLYYFPQLVAPGLSALKSLSFHQVQITELPACICQLPCLEILDLGKNRLTSLPFEFGRLGKLKNVELWGNNFTEFPLPLLGCERLESLSLGGNGLASLPDNIDKLKNLATLILSANLLKSLPLGLCALKKLKVLYLRRNPNLSRLPEAMIDMPALEEVFLFGTPVSRRSNVIQLMNINWLWTQKGK